MRTELPSTIRLSCTNESRKSCQQKERSASQSWNAEEFSVGMRKAHPRRSWQMRSHWCGVCSVTAFPRKYELGRTGRRTAAIRYWYLPLLWLPITIVNIWILKSSKSSNRESQELQWCPTGSFKLLFPNLLSIFHPPPTSPTHFLIVLSPLTVAIKFSDEKWVGEKPAWASYGYLNRNLETSQRIVLCRWMWNQIEKSVWCVWRVLLTFKKLFRKSHTLGLESLYLLVQRNKNCLLESQNTVSRHSYSFTVRRKYIYLQLILHRITITLAL